MIRRRAAIAATPSARLAFPLEAGQAACPYCSHGILAANFAPWTRRPRLVSADCECGRTVTMADITLQRRTEP